MPLWQSFDHPTHTWLPGMKFGRNKRTKVNQLLTAWKNKEDPAPGLFSLELDPAGLDQYLIVRNQSEEYWTSGIWNGINFAMIPEMISHHMFDFNYVSNQNESYFTYSVTGTIISRLIIDSSGQIMQLYWLESNKAWFQFWAQPRQPCEVYTYCGAFGSCNEQSQPFCSCLQGFQPKSEHDWNLQDYSGGCQRKSQLQCENSSLVNGKSDRFMATTIKDLPKHLQFAPVANIKQCETSCLNNCACTAYAYENNQCSIWIGSLLNLQQLAVGDTDGKTIYIKIAAYEFSSPRNDDRKFIDGGVGSAAFVLLLGLVVGVNVLNLLDTRLEGNADIEELLRICRVACWCIQDDETQRPSMGEVVQKLEGVLDVTQSPIPRSIQAYSHYQDHIIFFTASSSSSNQSPHSHFSCFIVGQEHHIIDT
ncbi:hypothetical protein Pint_02134 [Pistacia integerrima]|uniref:Uncharacterized protein n=1 Tax=Pistacia integerrima TaxID=434235 RepID=A0ACC0ZMQ0_9ROSI|nr:hypothetical protein Pint_02134 [Pistacia integerrima]